MTNSMEERLERFQSKTKYTTPTSALLDKPEPNVKEPKKESKKNDSNNKKKAGHLSGLFERKPRIEDTHTRRTFLVKNNLLERLDNMSNKPDNFTKTKFINYLIEMGLDELEGK